MRTRRPAVCALVVLALVPHPAAALQEEGTLPHDRFARENQITIGQVVSFSSEIYGEDRHALVYLPDDYSSTTARYPVVYLLDGAFFFLPTIGIVDFYSKANRMPRMIVVAIVHSDRMTELSTAASGSSAQFTSFLREELIPYVDDHLRTEPFRVLIGHSLGGMFAAHALFDAPELFQAHIAASPALYWNAGSELDLARDVLKPAPSLRNHLYLTYSGGDGRNIRTSTDELIALLDESAPPSLDWEFEFLPEDRHNSSPVRSVLGGLGHLFGGWTYVGEDTAVALIEHYRQLSAHLGFECRPEMGNVASRGRSLMRKGDVSEAIRVFEYNSRIHPEAAETHESLGAAYRTAGEIQKAIAAYQRALELSPGDEEISKILGELRKG